MMVLIRFCFGGAWPKRTVLRVKYNFFFFLYSSFRTFFSRIRSGFFQIGLRNFFLTICQRFFYSSFFPGSVSETFLDTDPVKTSGWNRILIHNTMQGLQPQHKSTQHLHLQQQLQNTSITSAASPYTAQHLPAHQHHLQLNFAKQKYSQSRRSQQQRPKLQHPLQQHLEQKHSRPQHSQQPHSSSIRQHKKQQHFSQQQRQIQHRSNNPNSTIIHTMAPTEATQQQYHLALQFLHTTQYGTGTV